MWRDDSKITIAAFLRKKMPSKTDLDLEYVFGFLKRKMDQKIHTMYMFFFFFKFFYLYKRFWFDSLLLQILQQLYLCSPCWYFDHYQQLLLRCLCHIQIDSWVRYPKEMAVPVCWQYFPHHPKVKVLFPTKKDVVVPKTFFIISLRKKNTVCLHKSLDIFVLFLGVGMRISAVS